MSDNFGYEDMVDGTEEEESTGSVEGYSSNNDQQVNQQVGQNPQMDEVKPVKLSKGKVTIIVVVFVLLVLFILKVLDGVHLTRAVDTTGQTQEVQTPTEQIESVPVENSTEVPTKTDDFSTVSSEVSGSSAEVSNNVNNSTVIDENQGSVVEGAIVTPEPVVEEEKSKANFEAVTQEPVMGTEVQVNGIVKGISMYKVGDSYTYGVNLILVVGNDENLECTYFCPKKTADALGIGMSLVVSYQCDSVGNICVVSISN